LRGIGGVSPQKPLGRVGGIGEARSFMGGVGIPGQDTDEVLMFLHPRVKTAKPNRSFWLSLDLLLHASDAVRLRIGRPSGGRGDYESLRAEHPPELRA